MGSGLHSCWPWPMRGPPRFRLEGAVRPLSPPGCEMRPQGLSYQGELDGRLVPPEGLTARSDAGDGAFRVMRRLTAPAGRQAVRKGLSTGFTRALSDLGVPRDARPRHGGGLHSASVRGEERRTLAGTRTRDRLSYRHLRPLQHPCRRPLPKPRRTIRIHIEPYRGPARPSEHGSLTCPTAREASRHATVRRSPRRATDSSVT